MGEWVWDRVREEIDLRNSSFISIKKRNINMSLCIHRLEKTTIFEKNSYRSWDVSTSVDINHLEDALDVQVIDPGLLYSKPFVGAKLLNRLCCLSVCFLCMLLIKSYLLFSSRPFRKLWQTHGPTDRRTDLVIGNLHFQ